MMRMIFAASLTLSTANAECLDTLLLDGMRLCLLTEHGDPAGKRQVIDILGRQDLLSDQQRLNLREAFSTCVQEDPQQTENFIACQSFDPRIPLNMGRSLLGRPAVSVRSGNG